MALSVAALLFVSLLVCGAAGVEVLQAQVYIPEATSPFGTYIEGVAVDGSGSAYCLNYLRDFDGSLIKDTDARTTLGQIAVVSNPGSKGKGPSLSFDSIKSESALALRGSSGSWNGARFAPSLQMPPASSAGTHGSRRRTVLLADQTGHRVMQGFLKAPGLEPELQVFCSSTEMVEPNDIVVASNGRVFATGMYWGQNTIVGHGDLWTCSPSAVQGGSVAARLERMGRTNGIELSPDESTLYVSEAFNKDFVPISNVVWQFTVDIISGAVMNKRLFVDFGALDSTAGNDVDGIRTDVRGNVYIVRNGGWEVAVFSPSGELIQRIATNMRYPSSLDFGGPNGRTLVIVGRCADVPWSQSIGCVDMLEMQYAGRSWTMLQGQ